MIKGITKGKSATLEFVSDKKPITGWKIRAEIYDTFGCRLKLATANSGGSDTQIKITDSTNGKFEIYIAEGTTKDFNDKSFIEIEADTGNLVGGKAEIITLFDAEIQFLKRQIDWTTP